MAGLYDAIFQLTRVSLRIWKRKRLFNILLSYVYAYSILGSRTWKIWPTDCYANATRCLLVYDGLTISLSANQNFKRDLRVNTTTRGPNAKI